MSWLVSAAAFVLGAAAWWTLPWGSMGTPAFALVLGVLILTERYRIPGGVNTRAELSITLAPLTAAMYWVNSTELFLAAAIAAVVGSLTRGRWGVAARWEISASVGAAAAATIVTHHTAEAGLHTIAAVLCGAVAYSCVRGGTTLAYFHGSQYAIPSWTAYLSLAVLQIAAGASLVGSYAAHPMFAFTRVLLVLGVISMWVLLWRYVRQSAMISATLLAAPTTVLPSLDAMTEAIAVAAERELVLPYTPASQLDALVASGQLDLLVAVVEKDQATSRVFRLSGDVDGHLQHRSGSWTTEYPEWVPKALESPKQDYFGHDPATGRMFYAFVAGPAAGPLLVLRVPLLETTWPGQRRMRHLGKALTGWAELMLRRYTHASRSKTQQLQDACARLVSLIETAGPADRVAEQLNHVHTLTTLSMMHGRTPATAASSPSAHRDRGRHAGVTMGMPPAAQHGGPV